jgi:hypothetical protein
MQFSVVSFQLSAGLEKRFSVVGFPLSAGLEKQFSVVGAASGLLGTDN